MADVFVSYKREELEVARLVALKLQEEGFSVFFDSHDEGGIKVGESWDERLERELAAARAVVVLWSPKSGRSDNVKDEARRAHARGVLAPAIIETCQPPLGLGVVQTANLIGWGGDRANPQWRMLIDRGVASLVGRRGRPPEGARAAQHPSRVAKAPFRVLPFATAIVAAAGVASLAWFWFFSDRVEASSSLSLASSGEDSPAGSAPTTMSASAISAKGILDDVSDEEWKSGSTNELVDRVVKGSSVEALMELATTGDARAQYVVGKIHFDGRHGRPRDMAIAERNFRMASERSFGPAQIGLGAILFNSDRNSTEAVALWQLASAQGYSLAKLNLASAYREGKGVAKDLAKALTLLTESASDGRAEAAYMLAQMALAGEGQPASGRVAEGDGIRGRMMQAFYGPAPISRSSIMTVPRTSPHNPIGARRCCVKSPARDMPRPGHPWGTRTCKAGTTCRRAKLKLTPAIFGRRSSATSRA